ncbi:hypothetical protein BU23DRAFT_510529 [Bimuria novae-zelandiae CBS 107.79]|uniref:Meiotically up-regulated gene 190 protein n=1 Tax=Bimuria novae-zelandiae CBS 107.79 TaxID=1447943 RepID=A0A6A5V194_9PLEO|nr:hypothetical protein BU23DRAFT_510529 [Bimuria novae-zelandiae CBS 107.79]
MSGVEDAEASQRKHKAPYTPHHPVPTVQKYREEKQHRQEQYGHADDGQQDDRSKTNRLTDAYTALRHGKEALNPSGSTQPYKAANKNLEGEEDDIADDHAGRVQPKNDQDGEDNDDTPQDTTEGTLTSADPKQARKSMKKWSADGSEREITDPVTHLPVTIHDYTEKDLKMTPENGPPAGTEPKSATGASAKNKTEAQLQDEQKLSQDVHSGTEPLFPPPDFAVTRDSINDIHKKAMTAGLGLVSASLVTVVAAFQLTRSFEGWSRTFFTLLEVAVSIGVSGAVIMGMRQWTENKINEVWESEVWQAEREKGQKLAKTNVPESAQWLNSFLASIWPLINPDLFTSISDTLEDVMQASLPKLVRMVSVDDIGQGSEAFRVLGVRWLPTGAAARSVGDDGQLMKGNEQHSDRTVPGEGDVKDNTEGKDEDEDGQDDGIAEGMEAEEGEFVNMEIAFAYRPSTGRRHMKDRAKKAHLYMAFYLPSNIKLPVWVEVEGFIGVMRVRLQLTPDPPFFSLCTLTFLGQPKVNISCVPLLKQAPNLMDFPLISRFVQSSVDAAMAEYVAPKSLTLDLKDMMMGDDFKKDTTARGVIMVTIKRAFDFKEGDGGIGPLKSGSADPYVSVGWAKFGKPMWSTRVQMSNMDPNWHETCFLLVSPDELNVDERLRLQLWDADRVSADDDLGRIEVDIKQLLKENATNGKVQDREDGFRSLRKGEGMPGKLCWSVGYFSKTRITDDQLTAQEKDPDVQDINQLRKKVYEESEQKLREASKDETEEVEQQKAQDFKARQDELIIASPPSQNYPSGILSIQIHQITGLEIEKSNKKKQNEDATEEEEEGDDLPSSYCTVILNHQKMFKTRTKPKNSKPFFNAGCERFIRDFRNTEVHISVRDARVHEDDALLGVIYLPLSRVLKHRSQLISNFPIAGGIGYGRARISIVFRSVQLQAPRNLLGWEYGTIEIKPLVKAIDIPGDLKNLRMKIRTSLARGKLYSGSEDSEANQYDGHTVWKTKRNHRIRLPVRKRYASWMIVEFRKDSALSDRTPAFAILWLKDIVDNEEQTIRLAVWKGDLSRAENNVLDSYGDKVGEIELTITFWSGLSGYHQSLAKKDSNLGNVLEVLDACNDNNEMDWDNDEESDSDSDTSSSSDENEDSSFVPSILHPNSNNSLDSDGKRGLMDQVREYKHNKKQLHRRKRGAMQWKGPRTLAYLKHLAERGENKVEGLFKHNDRKSQGVETEA